jgi:hypothetical protein
MQLFSMYEEQARAAADGVQGMRSSHACCICRGARGCHTTSGIGGAEGGHARADTLLDNLTVEEQLMYTAELKNPVRETLASKRAKVDLVLEQLALGGCRRVQIGNALNRGISGARCANPLPLLWTFEDPCPS